MHFASSSRTPFESFGNITESDYPLEGYDISNFGSRAESKADGTGRPTHAPEVGPAHWSSEPRTPDGWRKGTLRGSHTHQRHPRQSASLNRSGPLWARRLRRSEERRLGKERRSQR